MKRILQQSSRSVQCDLGELLLESGQVLFCAGLYLEMIQEKKDEKDVSLKRLQTGVDKIDEAAVRHGTPVAGKRPASLTTPRESWIMLDQTIAGSVQ